MPDFSHTHELLAVRGLRHSGGAWTAVIVWNAQIAGLKII